MRYVVTGGAGFIGSHLVRHIINEGHSVEIIDNLHKGTKNNIKDVFEKINFHSIDIRDEKKLYDILKNCDGVFHEAALTSAPESFKIPKEYFDVNVNGTKKIFEIAKKVNLRVVYASSSSIYGNVKELPIKEDNAKNPINPYGKTKLEEEYLAQKFSLEGLEVIGLRYFNVYGKGQSGDYAGVITQFFENIKLKKPLIINGDGNQIRDFIHVEDIVRANLIAMNSDVKNGFFNVGTGIGTSINDLAEIMIDISNYEMEPIHGSPLEGDIDLSQADVELIFSKLKWSSEIELKDGLKKLIEPM